MLTPIPAPRLAVVPLALLAVLLPAGPGARAQQAPERRAANDDYRALADYSRQRGGHAVLVMRGDRVVFEEYQNGYDAARPHMLASGTKSFSCALAVAAEEDGLLRLDEPAARTLAEWRGDPQRSRITLRQLLDLSSGLHSPEGLLEGLRVRDRNRAALSAPLLSAPGERFRYGPAHYFAFGEVMRRKLAPRGETVLGYLRRRVLDPIGLRVGRWGADRAGNPNLPGGAFLTAREWAKYGMLIRDGGRWRGRQVLREDLLRQCLVPSPANLNYGLTFWLDPDQDVEASLARDRSRRGRAGAPSPWRTARDPGARCEPVRVIMAAGLGKQRMYVIPSRGLVIVRFGRQDARFRDDEFLARLPGGRP